MNNLNGNLFFGQAFTRTKSVVAYILMNSQSHSSGPQIRKKLKVNPTCLDRAYLFNNLAGDKPILQRISEGLYEVETKYLYFNNTGMAKAQRTLQLQHAGNKSKDGKQCTGRHMLKRQRSLTMASHIKPDVLFTMRDTAVATAAGDTLVCTQVHCLQKPFCVWRD